MIEPDETADILTTTSCDPSELIWDTGNGSESMAPSNYGWGDVADTGEEIATLEKKYHSVKEEYNKSRREMASISILFDEAELKFIREFFNQARRNRLVTFKTYMDRVNRGGWDIESALSEPPDR
jgi:hypothetical protein